MIVSTGAVHPSYAEALRFAPASDVVEVVGTPAQVAALSAAVQSGHRADARAKARRAQQRASRRANRR